MSVEDPGVFSGWLQKDCRLALIRNLPFLERH
jgi:hypothetical protein